MALAERAMGLSYLAITEHSRPLAMAHDLDPRRPAEQCDAIDRLNEKLDDIVLLKGIEVDMLRVIRHARQRGWLAAADVLNTRPLPELRRLPAGARK
jgi:DNA polymerase (family 10)